ncbi:MAG: hypothetical protein IH587_12555, partial [Anaerolineae bacterium]|nr:hypothetical protein [Anaerolineae bacterium]
MSVRRSLWILVTLLALAVSLSLRPQITRAQDSVTLDRDDPSLVTYYLHDGD